MRRIESILALSPGKITAIYVGLGAAWILITDTIAAQIATSTEALLRLETAKGWLFIAISGLLIFGLTRYREHQHAMTESGYRTVSEHLTVIHRVLRHNIRNNLNIVMGFLDLAAEKTANDAIRADLARARTSLDEFIEMADKLRMIDDIDPIDPDRGPVDIVRIIEEEIERLEPNVESAVIETALPPSAAIHGGPAVRVIVRELLENAIEHHDGTAQLPRVMISVVTVPDRGTVTISDNGPGIPADDLSALDRGIETALTHSSGAGLWVVTWLVRLLDGGIDFDSDPETGTTVTLEFDRPRSITSAAEVIEDTIPLFESERHASNR